MTQPLRKNRLFAGTLLVCFIVAVLAGNSVAGMYRWVDRNGAVHVTDTPPQQADNAKIETVPTRQTDTKNPPEVKDPRANPPYAVQRRPPVKENNVELYTTSWCPWCKKARAFFQSNGVPFIEYDIEKDQDAARRKEQLDRNKGVPFAVINGTGINGYNEKAYNRALNR